MKCSQILDLIRSRIDDLRLPHGWTPDELIVYMNLYMDDIAAALEVWQEEYAKGYMTATDITFTAATKTIATVSGNFLHEGFYPGQTVTVAGSVSNNGAKTISTIAHTGKSMVVAEALVNEIAGATVILSIPISLCRIVVTSGVADYLLDTRMIDIQDAWLNSLESPVTKKDRKFIQTGVGYTWRTDTGDPVYYILDWRSGYITLYPKPDASDVLYLRVLRKTFQPFDMDRLDQEPEIPSQFHLGIVDGTIKVALEKLGQETAPDAYKLYTVLSNSHRNDLKMYHLRRAGEGNTCFPPDWAT